MTEVDVIDPAIAGGDASEALEIDQALEASPLLSAEVKDVEGEPYRLLIGVGRTCSEGDSPPVHRPRRTDCVGIRDPVMYGQEEDYRWYVHLLL